ncbi:hypothetical protein [Bradyrhizobium sp. Leo170]|uniref:hypothetical protein n=1 Tax=Bradyrhizobium sp. Leo170 TaxID=1571199 RepID=UPI00102E6404|nr:hypothetical protein [Bradyrhizobium sp. Leo170]TAI67604.1 hypothetical protein CWO89_01950 [Bradyrhizobium sp. Leo170]
MAEGERRKRRSKRTIQRERKRKVDARAAREQQRADKRAEAAAAWEAGYPQRAKRYQAEYERRIEHDLAREGQRKLMYAYLDYALGNDTPEARMVADYVRRNETVAKDRRQKLLKGGDPLGLLEPKVKKTKRQVKEEKRQEEAARLARGERFESIPDLEHPNQDVLVTTKAHSLRRKSLVRTHHVPGVEAFLRDIEAVQGGIRAASLGDKIDRSGVPNIIPSAIPAAQRIELCETRLGQSHWYWACGYLLFDMTPTEVHRRGGSQHTTASAKIADALDALCDFYDPNFLRQNRDLNILKDVVSRGMEVILQGERLLNWPHQQKRRTSR